jgi:hypothetical protein
MIATDIPNDNEYFSKQMGSISKTVMEIILKVPIGDCENTLSFPGEETSLGSGLSSHLSKRDAPCPSSPPHGFLHHTIETFKNKIDFPSSRFWKHTDPVS